MVEKKIIVKRKDGKIYEQTIKVFDTCEEYYGHPYKLDRDELSSMQRRIRRIERGLNELYRDRDFDDFDDVRKDINNIMRYMDHDEF